MANNIQTINTQITNQQIAATDDTSLIPIIAGQKGLL
jgi:hypothetical protein